MTTIRVSCPSCGAVDLTPADIRLTVVQAEDVPVGPESRYDFHCPSCAERVEKPADERIARLLSTGGVPVEIIEPTIGLGHPEDPPSGPPLTQDDLLDLHLLLESDGWFGRLASLTS
jgi:hypothetical protein